VLVTELDLPELDYLDPELRGARFHETMTALRAEHWLAKGPYGVFVLDRSAGETFLRSRSTTFPGLTIAELFDVKDGPLHEEIVRNIITINGKDHGRLRSLVNPAFTPRAADRYRPAMRGFLEELWEPVATAGGECEFVDAFAKPYPALTIATVMGAPLSDAPRLHDWSAWIQRQFDPPILMSHRATIEERVASFYEWAAELIAERKKTPGDDLISTLIAAEQDGDRLSDVECMNLVLNVLVGGVDTSQAQLSHAVRLLAEHPDQWAALHADPSLASAAVEEALRYEPITPFTARVCLEDVVVDDVEFPAGTVVMVSAWNGNRDPEVVEAPDVFDITTERAKSRILTFGAGIHYCLGANLARAELQEALGFLAERVERVELTGAPEFESATGIYGQTSLPVRLHAA
jgi:cytochrome P450